MDASTIAYDSVSFMVQGWNLGHRLGARTTISALFSSASSLSSPGDGCLRRAASSAAADGELLGRAASSGVDSSADDSATRELLGSFCATSGPSGDAMDDIALTLSVEKYRFAPLFKPEPRRFAGMPDVAEF